MATWRADQTAEDLKWVLHSKNKKFPIKEHSRLPAIANTIKEVTSDFEQTAAAGLQSGYPPPAPLWPPGERGRGCAAGNSMPALVT
jgi:hypothetical protein